MAVPATIVGAAAAPCVAERAVSIVVRRRPRARTTPLAPMLRWIAGALARRRRAAPAEGGLARCGAAG